MTTIRVPPTGTPPTETIVSSGWNSRETSLYGCETRMTSRTPGRLSNAPGPTVPLLPVMPTAVRCAPGMGWAFNPSRSAAATTRPTSSPVALRSMTISTRPPSLPATFILHPAASSLMAAPGGTDVPKRAHFPSPGGGSRPRRALGLSRRGYVRDLHGGRPEDRGAGQARRPGPARHLPHPPRDLPDDRDRRVGSGAQRQGEPEGRPPRLRPSLSTPSSATPSCARSTEAT